MYEVNTVDIMLSTTERSPLSLELRGERLKVELSPAMAAVLLAALQRQADEGQFDPQQYQGIELRHISGVG